MKSSYSRNFGQFDYRTDGKSTIRVIPLGGVGDVTKNMYVYEYRYDGMLKDILLVDCGVGFPDPDMYGVDLVIPDVRYLQNKKDKIRGLVFTHGHDDHIGGISYSLSKIGLGIPMWGTRLCAAFANIKLREAKIKNLVRAVRFDETLKIGPFTVSFVRMTHSIPDTSNLIIKTPIGVFYHASDFKFDFTPLDGKISELEKINAAGRNGVLCLLSDCLGSERRGFTPSEQVVGETLEKELSLSTGRVLFTTQSSNISRIQLAVDKAVAAGRQVAFFGRSMDQNTEEAAKLGYMKLPREMIIRDRDLKKLPANRQFLIIAGSQGQPESALSRVANDSHRFISIEEGDTVIFSADPIPGNEIAIDALIEQLYRKGARVSYTSIMEDLHVSGHGSQADLMLLLTSVNPRYVIPIGGTYRHMMQYRRLAYDVGFGKQQVIIPEDGDVMEFYADGRMRTIDRIELENIMVDGLGIGDVGNVVLRDRQTIASEGIVVIVVPMEKSTGRIIAEPDIVSRGFVYIKESGGLVERTRQLIISTLKLKKGRILDWQFVRKQIEEKVSAFLKKETGRNPLIVPVVVEV